MHLVLHDWGDRECQAILRQLRDALRPGYSRILLNEIVLPEQGCSLWQSANDLTMMAFYGGKERSREQRDAIMDSVGLKISQIWPPPLEDQDGESIIEIALR